MNCDLICEYLFYFVICIVHARIDLRRSLSFYSFLSCYTCIVTSTMLFPPSSDYSQLSVALALSAAFSGVSSS